MSTHEIREAVLTSASAEARARLFVERRLQEVRESLGGGEPVLFVQAMPLIAPETPWDVLSNPFEDVIRGKKRRGKYGYEDLATNGTPRPTIDGVLGQIGNDLVYWSTEAHRTGYVSLLYRDIKSEDVDGTQRPVVHAGTCDVFRSFCHMLKEFLQVSATDLPYLITSAYLNAEGTCVLTDHRWKDYSEPYEKKEIVWPEHLRATGEDPMVIAEKLCLEMFNAFGFKDVIK